MDARFTEMNEHLEKTFEDFAIMVAKGFSQVDKRFSQMDERFLKMEKRFEVLEKKVDDGFSRLNARIDALKENTARREDYFINESGYTKRRLDRIEKKIGLPPVPMLVRERKKRYGVLQKSISRKGL